MLQIASSKLCPPLINERGRRNSRSFAPDLPLGVKDFLAVDLFRLYLLSRVDIVIRYIEVGFMFVLPDYVGVISKFYSIHFTVTLAVRYIQDFVKWRFVKSRFHCITNPPFNEQIWAIPSDFVKSRFHCNSFLHRIL